MIRFLFLLILAIVARAAAPTVVERWGIFETELRGPADGNPFVDVNLTAVFTPTGGAPSREVAGFYDGNGVYRLRFMPETVGSWSFVTHSNLPSLDAQTGKFVVTAAATNNHGPVRVRDTFHFAYADGTPFRQIGTTCYAWTHQGDALEEQTLRTLAASPFNKLRMCVFPKNYDWNKNDPPLYPFAGKPPTHWDYSRFNPSFFQHLERRIAQLGSLGLEADLILFHPYDKGRWGFDRMEATVDDRYLRYVVARLAAYRNVWWSLANEYDFMKEKTENDWDRLFQIVQRTDPHDHLRSIHNGTMLYNHTQPWVTHASIQNGAAVLDAERAVLYRDAYRKPIVFDEVKYEGDIPRRWGNLTAEELVLRFWMGTVAGTYVGHGETYLHPDDDVLWWSKGGTLRGQSPARLAFLRRVLEDSPPGGLNPIDKWQDTHTAGVPGEYYLVYFGHEKPAQWLFALHKDRVKEGDRFAVEVIDTWSMTISRTPGVFVAKKRDAYTFEDQGQKAVHLPGLPYHALRIRRLP